MIRQARPIPTRRASARQEKKVAKELGAKIQSNSGATDYQKGDIIAGSMLVECKTVMKPQQSVSIKKEWFDKNGRIKDEYWDKYYEEYNIDAVGFWDKLKEYEKNFSVF